MPLPIIPLLLSNWQLIAKIVGAVAIAFACWWFLIHNPKIIKQLEEDKAELTRQVANRDAAILMLGEIGARHEVINRTVYRNISSIRYLPKPGRDGNLYGSDGMPKSLPVNAPPR